jgi:NAD(P)-dependent dehydrogenase (short-subunit alcohol dehydrogenase family)
MPSVLISGANRGLGLEFAKQYAAAGWRVYATCRDAGRADALKAIPGTVSVHSLDVADKASLSRLALELKAVPLDVVIANAGVSGPRGMQPELVDRDSWLETLQVNTLGPLALAGAFKPNLEKGRLKKVVAITSRLGSIALNDTGGLYVYRSSKAALNAVWRSLAIDWKPLGMICAVLHPGWVRTDMGGPNGDIDATQSVTGMRQVIDGLTPESSGRFFNWSGEDLAW